MSEPTLTLTYDDLLSQVGHKVGWGRSSGGWTTDEAALTAEIVQAGYRKFLFHEGFRWSFLRPVTTLSLSSNDWDYNLPDDFGGLFGEMMFQSQTEHSPLKIVGEAEIRRLRQVENGEGRPFCAAVRPLAHDFDSGHRYECIVYPTPDSSYTLIYSYYVVPNNLDTTNKYPLGGTMYSEVLREACLAVAETRMDDEIGVHSQLFEKLITEAMMADGKLRSNTPEFFGYNSDDSDQRGDSFKRAKGVVSVDRVVYAGGSGDVEVTPIFEAEDLGNVGDGVTVEFSVTNAFETIEVVWVDYVVQKTASYSAGATKRSVVFGVAPLSGAHIKVGYNYYD